MSVCVFVNRTRGVCVRQKRNALRGKRKDRNYLFVDIALTPGRRSDAESDFHSVGAFSESSFRLVEKNQKPKFPHIFGRTNVRACTPLKGFARRLDVS